MKVRPSAKKMCEKCRIIRRERRGLGDLLQSATQAKAGLKWLE